jgi:hypothetical protein
MKKLIGYSSSLGLVVLLAGCVGPMGTVGGTAGTIYTDVSGAGSATSNSGTSKVGESKSKGILGVAWGDSSIKAACAAGNITKISHIDYHVTNVIGVYQETTVTVYGE